MVNIFVVVAFGKCSFVNFGENFISRERLIVVREGNFLCACSLRSWIMLPMRRFFQKSKDSMNKSITLTKRLVWCSAHIEAFEEKRARRDWQ